MCVQIKGICPECREHAQQKAREAEDTPTPPSDSMFKFFGLLWCDFRISREFPTKLVPDKTKCPHERGQSVCTLDRVHMCDWCWRQKALREKPDGNWDDAPIYELLNGWVDCIVTEYALQRIAILARDCSPDLLDKSLEALRNMRTTTGRGGLWREVISDPIDRWGRVQPPGAKEAESTEPELTDEERRWL